MAESYHNVVTVDAKEKKSPIACSIEVDSHGEKMAIGLETSRSWQGVIPGIS